MSDITFETFRKIPRYSRDIVITEKIDGTNAQIYIEGDLILAGSRNRWLDPHSDNFGFCNWVYNNKKEIIELLGDGRHYGEWWGHGIQRGYNLKEKRFSLFNVKKWEGINKEIGTSSIFCVPILYYGYHDQVIIEECLNALKEFGSKAEPGFMKPEGIVIYHTAANVYFKKTIEKDETFKGK